MRCPACGGETPDAKFCTVCGAQLHAPQQAEPAEPQPASTPQQPPAHEPPAQPQPGHPQQPPAQPQAPQPPAQQAPAAYAPQPGYPQQPPGQPPYPQQPPAPPPKKKRGCLKGCLITVLILALVGFAACAWLNHWPEKWGLVASPAEKVFEQSPDPFAVDALMSELETAGLVADGLDAYVMPALERDGSLAYFILDESRGFSWWGDYESPVESLMVLVATSEAAAAYDIELIGVDFRDATGEQVVVLVAPTDITRAYGEGTASRDDFLLALDGRSTLGQLLESQMEWIP